MDTEQWEIRSGGTRAVVTTFGAGLRVLEVDGRPYSETYPEGQEPPMGAGAVLVPWPNRVAGGVWPLDEVPQHLNITEPARGNAIHGLVRKEDWTVGERTDDAVTLSVVVDRRPGWPFTFETSVKYAVGPDGLKVTHGVRNLCADPMPFGVGTHPYPRAGALDVGDLDLRLAATTHLPLDADSMTPSGPATPIDSKLRSGAPLRELSLDDAFGGCEPGADGLVRHTLTDSSGRGVQVWAEPVFKWVQVYTPAAGSFGPGRSVAIEPMTCPPDALNSGTDVLTVAPGASWSASWGIGVLV
ncbi:aldose 1-epimerase family protein [Actinokineospora pegani]|uniref:aldose 1-epimerase family protein n=1 Tax=Actinokineospora pegani TaxID=2654637 RepID=UPI0012EAB7CE|nr:aldose 1-epimerase family protein [Actinokineospora pegani]